MPITPNIPEFCLFNQTKKVPMPIESIRYDCDITDNMAKVTQIIEYFNNSETNINASLLYPKSLQNHYCGMKIYVGDVIIEGNILENKIAKQKYEKAVQDGNCAILLKQSENNQRMFNDRVQILIGNLYPQMRIKVHFDIAYELEMINDVYCFKIPTTLNPLYKDKKTLMENYDKIFLKNSPLEKMVKNNCMSNDKKHFKSLQKFQYNNPWHISLKVNGIEDPDSFSFDSTHNLEQESFQQNTVCFELSTKVKQNLIETFIFKFFTDKTNKPKLIVSEWQENKSTPYAFYMQFNPVLDKESDDICIMNCRAEFVFVIDRSGSMSGKPIRLAKEALLYFLKSLPEDSYFNIVSFGSYHQFMFENSQKISQDIINQALNDIQNMEGNMGGTELNKTLEDTLSQKEIAGYPKKIYLLTDGYVYDTKTIFENIKRLRKESRIYTLGIGSSFDEELVKGVAEYGKGMYTFVKNINEITEDVMYLLQKSISDYLEIFDIEYPKDIVEYILPQQRCMHLYNGENLIIQGLFKGPKYNNQNFTIKFKQRQQIYQDIQQHQVQIRINNTVKSSLLHKIISSKIADILDPVNQREEIIKLSKDNKIVTKVTSLFLEYKKNIDVPKDTIQVDIQVLKSNQEQDNLEVTVKTLSGKVIQCFINSNTTTMQLKDQITVLEGFPCDDQRLIFDGSQLKDDCHLLDYGIENKSVIHLVMTLRGGGYCIYKFQIKNLKDNKISQKQYEFRSDQKQIELIQQIAKDYQLNLEDFQLKQDDKLISYKSGDQYISLSQEATIVELDILDNKNDKNQILNQIVREQNVDGSWSKNQKLIKTLNQQNMINSTQMMKINKEDPNNIVFTTTILEIIKKYFPQHKRKWNLIYQKGLKYVQG